MSAPRNSRKRERTRRGGSAPLWFVAGGLVAVLVIFGYPALRGALQHTKRAATGSGVAFKNPTAKISPATAAGAESAAFDFYHLLAHPTQILTASETPELQQAPAAQSVAKPGAYVLQVASFRAAKDAEALKAQLALWGVSASIQAVAVQGETWHRVRIGPVSNLATLNALRTRLAAHKLQPLIIRVGN